ncbi:MAG: cytidylate kinase-like family protein [Chloroflexota bacterium]|nr:cytidylate kinase-like family protein [Chloroflexota bacterium]
MPVITISRQFGAAGGAVGRAVADRFGAEFLDRQIIALVATRAGIPESEAEGYDERLPGLWQRLAAAFATGYSDVVLPSVPLEALPGPGFQDRVAALTRAIIEEAADRGNAVIVGRGGAFILAGRTGVFNVQLHAAVDARVGYLLSQVEEIPPDARPDEPSLRNLCLEVDAARARYLRRHFGVDWNDSRHYDLALDTGRLGLALAADLIDSAARRTAT